MLWALLENEGTLTGYGAGRDGQYPRERDGTR